MKIDSFQRWRRSLLGAEEIRLLGSVLVDRDPSSEISAVNLINEEQLPGVFQIGTLLHASAREHLDRRLRASANTPDQIRFSRHVAHHRAVLEEVLDVARSSGVDIRIIKGLAAADLEPWRSFGRTCSDVDVLVACSSAETMVSELLARGFRPIHRSRPTHVLVRYDRSIDLARGRDAIDVHWHLDELLIFGGRGGSPFGEPARCVALPELPGLAIPAAPRAHLLLHVAARLGRCDRRSRLRSIVDAHALAVENPNVFREAAERSPSTLIDLRLRLLAGVLRMIDPGLRIPDVPSGSITRTECVQEMLAGPSCVLAHWSTDWMASYLALMSAEIVPPSIGGATRYVLARKWGIGGGQ